MPAFRISFLCFCLHWIGCIARSWPDCIIEGKGPSVSSPIFVDMRPYIQHPDDFRHTVREFSSKGNIGMVLREWPHELGEMVEDVLVDSQAWLAGVRKGWIITSINDRRFSSTERLDDVTSDFAKAKQAGATLRVKYDVRTAIDCTNADCRSSNRLPTASAKQCSIVCGLTQQCKWWSFEKGSTICTFYASVSDYVPAPTVSVGSSSCVPTPEKNIPSSWPSCVIPDATAESRTPLFADVRNFINHPDEIRHREIIFASGGNIGMGLREQPHELGEIVSEVLLGSQAFHAGVAPGWIIKEVAGKPFEKDDALEDIVDDFTDAKAAKTLTVKFDVRSSVDCTAGDCKKSEKFPARSQEACAAACSQLPSCASWAISVDEVDTMCWLRRDFGPLKAQVNAAVGSRDCNPALKSSSSSLFVFVVFTFALAFSYRRELPRLFGLDQFTPKRSMAYPKFMVELGVISDHIAGNFADKKERDPLTSCKQSLVGGGPLPSYGTQLGGGQSHFCDPDTIL